ncbi:MAG: hypothetical protein BA872_01135 [Desulfobacterales bacterium C00003060]|nr:MAG: hypothetical protein BA865_04810 [Desulfobacterales bacterium S5133MH4]OEU81415.1 MAG: hypothetical protein BA872_01135 [Desulfobacterales bacterium C00003060]
MSARKSPSRNPKVGLVILSLVFVGISGYVLCRSFTSRHSQPPVLPVFESYPSQSIETQIKQIDQCIYDTLLVLNIPAGDVTFKTVEPKMVSEESWAFSELEICFPTTLQRSNIEQALFRRLSEHIQRKSLRFASISKQELVLDISINTHHTHRLVFVRCDQERPVASQPSSLPLVAIIIDDLGYDEIIASKFLALDGVLSFSVLPHSPFQESIATAIHNSGRDVLLHLPMQPMEYPQVDPGAGALLCSMTPDVLVDQLRKNLDSVPFAVGVNNHMGSRLTQDSGKMRRIFAVLKRRDLFFVDSFTTPRSCCRKTAHALKLKFAQRQVFLDHVQDPNAIRFQIKRLITIAGKQGKAIGIGHPYATTLKVLKEELSNIKKRVNLVRISELAG